MNDEWPRVAVRNAEKCFAAIQPNLAQLCTEAHPDPRVRRQVETRTIAQGFNPLLAGRGIENLLR
jgi:hypothetical protein